MICETRIKTLIPKAFKELTELTMTQNKFEIETKKIITHILEEQERIYDYLADLADLTGVCVSIVHPKQPSKEEPRKGEFWVNVYGDDFVGGVNDSRVDANEQADELSREEFGGVKRIACVKVTWTEGEGLDD